MVYSCTLAQDVSVSKVMLIGEQDPYYESLVMECNTLLLSVTENKMEQAFDIWTNMLESIEAEAETADFDIKGVKLWINLFWNEDGSIKNIFYYPKPNSKNMDFEKLTSFLNRFADEYSLPKSYKSCFSHYGSAAFPIRTRVVTDVE